MSKVTSWLKNLDYKAYDPIYDKNGYYSGESLETTIFHKYNVDVDMLQIFLLDFKKYITRIQGKNTKYRDGFTMNLQHNGWQELFDILAILRAWTDVLPEMEITETTMTIWIKYLEFERK